MAAGDAVVCKSCGVEISTEVPEYYIELERYRIIKERWEKSPRRGEPSRRGEPPRRGSKEYHEATEGLMPEIKAKYFKNKEMYDGGHLWCPACGTRLGENGGFGLL